MSYVLQESPKSKEERGSYLPFQSIKVISKADTVGGISDGYHTFDELYEHRIELWKTVCRMLAERYCEDDPVIWRTLLHSDGTQLDGWFVLGAFYEKGKQISYHLPASEWKNCNFAVTLERVPEYDGHTPADVLERLRDL